MKEPALLLDKQLPSNIEVEKIILGSILIDNQILAKIINQIKPEYFYSQVHKNIYGSMLNLFNSGIDITPVYIFEDAKKVGFNIDIKTIVGTTFGLPLLSDSEILKYCEVLKEKWALRQIIKACNLIANNAVAEDMKVNEVINDGAQMLSVISNVTDPINALAIDRLVAESIQRTISLAQGNTTMLGISTGLVELDAKLLGLQKTDLIILGARPSMGKTSLCLMIAANAAIRNNKKVLIFSLEMGANQLVDRILCQIAEIDSQNYRIGNLSEYEWKKIEAIQIDVATSGLIIDDSAYVNTQYIRTRIREEKLKHEIDLVIIDYLQLMSGNSRNESRYAEITQISRELKLIAKEFDIPLLVLSQLNRMSETRKDKRPLLADLRESGAIEQDADIVIFIHRDEITELIIAKHRNGPVGVLPVHFNPTTTRFSDLKNNF